MKNKKKEVLNVEASKSLGERGPAQWGQAQTLHAQGLEERRVENSGPSGGFFLPNRLRQQGNLNEPMRQHGWTYAIIQALAINIMQVPLNVCTGTKKDHQVIEDEWNPWVRLLEDPNPELSLSQVWELTVEWLSLSGECFWVKESHENRRILENEIPFEVWPMNGRLFDPLVNRVTKRAEAWAYRDEEGKLELFLPHELVIFRRPNPYDRWRGLAPAEAAAVATRGDWKAGVWNEVFFDNNASPGLVLYTTRPEIELTPKQRKELREQWED